MIHFTPEMLNAMQLHDFVVNDSPSATTVTINQCRWTKPKPGKLSDLRALAAMRIVK